MAKFFSCLLIVAALFVSVPVYAQNFQQGSFSAGSVPGNGYERSFYYYIPKKPYDGKRPLVLSLHGGGKDDGDDYGARAGYLEMADKAGFIVVHPNGIEGQWNDGRGMTYNRVHGNTDIDDVAFLTEVIDYFVDEMGADPARVFVEGSSNGGMMTQRLACEIPHKITAAASVIASMPVNVHKVCDPSARIPMLLLNGTADPVIPWDGGEVTIGRKTFGDVISTPKTIDFWVKHNRCKRKAEVDILKDRAPRDDSTVKKYTYRCGKKMQVVLYEIVNGGHSRPNPGAWSPERLLGEQNRDIRAAVEIWKFFRQF